MAQTVLDPAAPIGIQAGRFTILPAVDTTTTLTQGDAMAPGWSTVISPEIRFQADWGVHSSELFFGADFSPTEGTMLATLAELNLQFDLWALWTLDLGASYAVRPRDESDATLPDGVDELPNIRTIAANGTLAGPIGAFAVELNAGVQRTLYDDAMVGGFPVDQSEGNRTVVTAGLRLETDGGGLFTPFVEANGGRRIYDQLVGTDGFLQASNFAELRLGIAYDSAPVLTGEIGAQIHWELPDDPGLSPSRSFSVDGNAVWSPREPIRFTLSATTAFTPDASPDWGDSITRSLSLSAAWDIFRSVQLTVGGGRSIETYADATVEETAFLGGGLTWSPDRWIRFSANYVHEWRFSPDPDRAGTSSVFTLTARVQR